MYSNEPDLLQRIDFGNNRHARILDEITERQQQYNYDDDSSRSDQLFNQYGIVSLSTSSSFSESEQDFMNLQISTSSDTVSTSDEEDNLGIDYNDSGVFITTLIPTSRNAVRLPPIISRESHQRNQQIINQVIEEINPPGIRTEQSNFYQLVTQARTNVHDNQRRGHPRRAGVRQERRNISRHQLHSRRRESRFSFILRTVLIFSGGIIPILFEMCQLRDTLSQFLDHHSWIILKKDSNPETLHHDVVVRLPNEFIAASNILARSGLCFAKTTQQWDELQYQFRRSNKSVQNDLLTQFSNKYRTHFSNNHLKEKSDFANISTYREHRSSFYENFIENSYPVSSFLSDGYADTFSYRASIESLSEFKQADIILLLMFSGSDPIKKVVNVSQGEIYREENNLQEIMDVGEKKNQSHILHFIKNSTAIEEKNTVVNRTTTQIMQNTMWNVIPGLTDKESLKENFIKSFSAFKSKMESRKQLKAKDQRIGCPIKLTPLLCESVTFVKALKHPYQICKPLLPHNDKTKANGRKFWRKFLHFNLQKNITLLGNIQSNQSISTTYSALNERYMLRGTTASSVSLFETKPSIVITPVQQTQFLPFCRTYSASLFWQSLAFEQPVYEDDTGQCFNPNVDFQSFIESNHNNREARTNVDRNTRNTKHIKDVNHNERGSLSEDWRNEPDHHVFPDFSFRNYPIALFVASAVDDDVTPSVLFRFTTILFVFSRWISAEMRVVIEMFLPPISITEILSWWTLFSFTSFMNALQFCSKVFKVSRRSYFALSQMLVKLITVIEDWLIQVLFLNSPLYRLIGIAEVDERSSQPVDYEDNQDNNFLSMSAEDENLTTTPDNATASPVMEIHPNISLHAIWRTLNFSIHYLWSALAIICLQNLFIDGTTLTSRSNTTATLPQMYTFQKFAWAAYLGTLVLLRFREHIVAQSPFTSTTRLSEAPLQYPRTIRIVDYLKAPTISAVCYVAIGYSMATTVLLLSQGFVYSSISPVGLYISCLMAETLLRAIFGLEYSAASDYSINHRRPNAARRGRRTHSWFHQNEVTTVEVDNFNDHYFRTTGSRVSSNEAVITQIEINPERLQDLHSAMGDGNNENIGVNEHMLSPLNENAYSAPRQRNGLVHHIVHHVTEFELLETTWMRIDNRFELSQNDGSIIGRRPGYILQMSNYRMKNTRLLVVEKAGVNFFKIVDPTLIKDRCLQVLDSINDGLSAAVDESLPSSPITNDLIGTVSSSNCLHNFSPNSDTTTAFSGMTGFPNMLTTSATAGNSNVLSSQTSVPLLSQLDSSSMQGNIYKAVQTSTQFSRDSPVSNSFCYVCMTSEDDAIFLPCLHGGSCLRCGRAVLSNAIMRRTQPRCPLCRQAIRALGQLENASLLDFFPSETIALPSAAPASTCPTTLSAHPGYTNHLQQYKNNSLPYQTLRIVLAIRRAI